MRKGLLIFVLLCVSIIAIGQKSDTSKVNALNLLSKSFLINGNLNKSMSYAKEALSLAERIDYKIGKVNSYNYIGSVLLEQSNNAEAIKKHFKALKIAEEIGYKTGIANSHINIGNVYSLQENYPEAIKNHLAALEIAEEINNRNLIANSYVSLGNDFNEGKNYSESLKNYLAGLKIFEELNDRRRIAISCINIGSLYIAMNLYLQAREYLMRSLQLSNVIENKPVIAATYINLGVVCIKLKKLEEAKEYYTKGLQLSKEIKSKNYIRKSYLGLSTIDSINGNYKGAYEYFRLYSRIKDSILNETSDKQISQFRIMYETEKKDKEIKLKSVRIEKQRSTIWYVVGGFLIFIVFAIIVLYLYYQRRKSIFRHKVLETEMKALRSQMNPHFTFNVLNSIQYFISENDMESAELYIEKFASLIRMILDQSRTAYITLEQEISILKLYLELEEMRFEKKFNYTMDIDSKIETGKLLIPGMLIQPIVENAIKHGIRYKEGDAMIKISFSTENSKLVCRVADNGIGQAEAEKLKAGKSHKSVATAIIRERMEALSSIYNIKLAYNTEDIYNEDGKPDGIRVTIEIPIVMS